MSVKTYNDLIADGFSNEVIDTAAASYKKNTGKDFFDGSIDADTQWQLVYHEEIHLKQNAQLVLMEQNGLGDKTTITISQLAREGDEVIYYDDEGYDKEVPDFSKGIIIGFTSSEFYKSRIDSKIPGKYVCKSSPIVKFFLSNGESKTIVTSYHYLWHDKTLHESRQNERKTNSLIDEFSDGVKIGELPDLNVFEGDTVLYKFGTSDEILEGIVNNINYYNDRSKIELIISSPYGGTLFAKINDVSQVTRGNIWKYFNGKKDEIVFKDIIDEANFHKSLHFYEECRNPNRDNLFHWEQEDIDEAIKSGLVDCFSLSHLFGPHLSGIKFTDREFGERMRQHALQIHAAESAAKLNAS